MRVYQVVLYIIIVFHASEVWSENGNIPVASGNYPNFKMPSKEEMKIQSENFQLMAVLHKHKDYPSMWGPMDGSAGYQFPEMDGMKKKSVVKTYGNVVNFLVDKLPNSALRNGLKKYLEIINTEAYQGSDVSVGASNAGLSSHGAKRIENNICFSKIAEAFYGEIQKQDLILNPIRKPEDYLKPLEQVNPLNGRPTLDEESGKGRFKDLEPGWLMKKAMKFSGGDSGLAMRLISLCGHDDVSQGRFAYQHEADNKQAMQAKYLRAMDAQIEQQKKMIEIMKNPPKYNAPGVGMGSAPFVGGFGTGQVGFPGGDSDNNNVSSGGYFGGPNSKKLSPDELKKMNDKIIVDSEDQLKKLQDFRRKIKLGEVELPATITRQVRCPMNSSSMYLPKALGREVDLSDKQKKQIVSIQAPTKGGNYLPAKAYHFMGSAYLSCRLAEEGIAPNMAQAIQKMVAWGYRTIRMNNVISNGLNEYEKINKAYTDYVKKFQSDNMVKIKTPRGFRRKSNGKKPMSFQEFAKKQAEREKTIPPSDNLLTSLDAAKLMDNSFLGGEMFFGLINLPHTNLSVSFLGDPIERHIRAKEMEAAGKVIRQRRGGPSAHQQLGWSKDRYDKAKDKMMTWLVDWDWTTNQHSIGASFGAKVCKEKMTEDDMEKRACNQFDGRQELYCHINYGQLQETVGNFGGIGLGAGFGSYRNDGAGGSVEQDLSELENLPLMYQLKEMINSQMLDKNLSIDETKPGYITIKGAY